MPKDRPLGAHLEDAYSAFKDGDGAEAVRMAKAVTVMARASTGKQARAEPIAPLTRRPLQTCGGVGG